MDSTLQTTAGMAPVARPAPRRSSVTRAWREKAIEIVITLVAFTGIGALLMILLFVGKEALPLFLTEAGRTEASLSKMFLPQIIRAGKPAMYMWQPVSSIPKVSMIPLFLGTVKVTVVAMTVAVPLGIAAALFASEFAPRRLREVLKPAVELLAGIPSVVLGFFALMVLADRMQEWLGFSSRLNAVVAGVGLALAIIPVIFTVCEDALTAVPRSYREASLALGATRWETAWKVVLPAATPGIVAAVILGFGRAIGETMVVLMASGNAAIVSANFGDSVRSLSATIAAEMGEVVVGAPHYSLLFFIGVELFCVTFVLNLLAAAWVRRLQRRLTGATS